MDISLIITFVRKTGYAMTFTRPPQGTTYTPVAMHSADNT